MSGVLVDWTAGEMLAAMSGQDYHPGRHIKVSCSRLEEQARRGDGLDVPTRLQLLALARCRPDGHVQCFQGELAMILGVTASSVSRGIAIAKKRGLLHNASNSRCLVMPGRWVSSNYHGSTFCPVHGISLVDTSEASDDDPGGAS